MPHNPKLGDVWDQPDRSVPTAEAAEVLGLPVRQLERWRAQKKGPRYRKYGGKIVDGRPVGGGLIRYTIGDLKAFSDSCVVDAGTTERQDIGQEVTA